MKSWFAAMAMALVVSVPAAAEDAVAENASSDDAAKMMGLMQKYGMPGPEHKFLAPIAGQWTYTSKMWMDPSVEPMTMNGNATYELTHGGRFLEQSVDGNMMGMPWTGTGLIGFDRYSSEAFMIWYDSMGTGSMTSKGSVSDDGKTFTFEGEYDDWWNGIDDKWTKQVMTLVDNDTMTFEMFEKRGDDEVRVMLIESKRADVAEAN